MYKQNTSWGYSSAGRALEWHSRGQRFDPAYLHQLPLKHLVLRGFFMPDFWCFYFPVTVARHFARYGYFTNTHSIKFYNHENRSYCSFVVLVTEYCIADIKNPFRVVLVFI